MNSQVPAVTNQLRHVKTPQSQNSPADDTGQLDEIFTVVDTQSFELDKSHDFVPNEKTLTENDDHFPDYQKSSNHQGGAILLCPKFWTAKKVKW